MPTELPQNSKPFERTRYGFDRLTDGKIWMLQHGQDYKISDFCIQAYLYRFARRYGMKARCSNPDEGIVVVQFYLPEDPKQIQTYKPSPLSRLKKYPFRTKTPEEKQAADDRQARKAAKQAAARN